MMRVYFLVAVLILFSAGSYAQAQSVQSFGGSYQKKAEAREGSAGGVQNEEVPANDISSAGDNKLKMKSGRTYSFRDSALSEEVKTSGQYAILNVYDFDSQIVIHLVQKSNDSIAVSRFSDISAEKIKNVKRYACRIVASSRSTDGVYFRRKYCGGR